MVRLTTACFCLTLICSQVNFDVSAKGKDLRSYDLEDAIQDIDFFIPGSKAVLTTAIKIWLLYGKVEQLINPNSTLTNNNSSEVINKHLMEISDKLDLISHNLYDIKGDIKELNDFFQEMASKNIPQEESLLRILSLFETNIELVNTQFNYFLKYNNNPKKRKHANETLLNYAHRIVDHGLSELPAVMDKLYSLLMVKALGKSAIDMLSDSRLSTAMMCNREMSAQHKINTIYNELTMAEIKNLLMVEFAYSLKKLFNNESDFQTEIEEAREKSFQRMSKIIKFIKNAMTKAQRDFWRCDPPEHIEGETYAKLGPVFQAYLAKEKDLYDSLKEAGSCVGSCSDRIKSKDSCVSKFCKERRDVCTSSVYDCVSTPAPASICFRHNNSTASRYKYIYSDDVEYGTKDQCIGPEHTARKSYKNVRHCDVCMCTCVSDDPDINRYFSLRDVIADEKKVVTGVRLQLENNVFHIQIKQATLKENGNVKSSTNSWKRIENFSINDNSVKTGKDYYKVTYDQKRVLLDNLDSPPNNVITGLRFRHENDYVKLEIRRTPFNFETGELNVTDSSWISHPGDIYSRKPKIVSNLDLPTNSRVNTQISSDNQYIDFTTSSLKTDVGQTVVPFIDLQPLETEPPVPISGAGLIHKSNKDTSGFLAFKISTFNYAPYLQ